MHVLQPVKPRKNLLQERNLLRTRPVTLKLREPERPTAAGLICLLHVPLEIADIRGLIVPVDGDEIDRATRAGGEEVLEPGQAHWGAAVGHGRSAERVAAGGKGLDVGFVGGDGGADGHVGLLDVVWLVERKDTSGGGSGGKGGRPAGGERGGGRPEHGDVVEGAGQALRYLVPVVSPGDEGGRATGGDEGESQGG